MTDRLLYALPLAAGLLRLLFAPAEAVKVCA
jgi:hypothetical protein